MRDAFDVPNWTIDIVEVSAGVYQATGTHRDGAEIQATGSDLEELRMKIRAYAIELNRSLSE